MPSFTDLLAFPPEIRILIFEYVFIASFPLVNAAGILSFPAASDTAFRSLCPLLVYKGNEARNELAAEVRAVFHARNRFVFDCRGIDKFLANRELEKTGMDKDLIKQISFIVPLRWRLGDRSILRRRGKYPFKFGSSLRKVVRALPKLKSVFVYIQMRDNRIGPQEGLRNLARPLLELWTAGILQRLVLTEYRDRWNYGLQPWGGGRPQCKGNAVEQIFWKEDNEAREEGNLEKGKEAVERYMITSLFGSNKGWESDKAWFRVIRRDITNALQEEDADEDGAESYYMLIPLYGEHDFAGSQADYADQALARQEQTEVDREYDL